MSSTAHEIDAPGTTPTRWEARSVPEDYRVEIHTDPEADLDDITTVEAFWAGETKVRAEIDFYDGVANIDRVGRPSHWHEDRRAPEEQQREYELGMDGILKKVMTMSPKSIEINDQSGVIASAIMDLKVPAGWERSLRVIKYESSWSASETIDIREAVSDGAVISLRYERSMVPPPRIGRVALAGLSQGTELSRAA